MNRIAEVFLASTREIVGCKCEYPCCVEVADVVVDHAEADQQCMRVDRYSDCMLCGPFRQRLTVTKPPGAIRRGTTVVHPLFWGYRTEGS